MDSIGGRPTPPTRLATTGRPDAGSRSARGGPSLREESRKASNVEYGPTSSSNPTKWVASSREVARQLLQVAAVGAIADHGERRSSPGGAEPELYGPRPTPASQRSCDRPHPTVNRPAGMPARPAGFASLRARRPLGGLDAEPDDGEVRGRRDAELDGLIADLGETAMSTSPGARASVDLPERRAPWPGRSSRGGSGLEGAETERPVAARDPGGVLRPRPLLRCGCGGCAGARWCQRSGRPARPRAARRRAGARHGVTWIALRRDKRHVPHRRRSSPAASIVGPRYGGRRSGTTWSTGPPT